MENHSKRAKFLIASLFVIASLAGCGQSEIREASGVVVKGNDSLVLVGDASPGQIFSIDISKIGTDKPNGFLLHQITVDNGLHKTIGGDLALDLESVEILPNGEVVVLSERLHSLVGKNGIVAEYPDAMAEIGGKGLEGVAIGQDGIVVVLWEGGFYEQSKLPRPAGFNSTGPLKPLICIHRIDPDDVEVKCTPNGLISLDVPVPPIATQAFRAADLVWGGTDSIIVLLSSTNSANNAFKYKWLQKFKTDGRRIGNPLNLCARGYLPTELRDGRDSNFEGMDWYEEGKSVVLINDYKALGTAVFISIESWPAIIDSTPCDQPL